MILTPALDQPVGDLLGRARRDREHADDDLLVGDDLARARRSRARRGSRRPACPTSSGSTSNIGDDPEAVVGEDVGAGDRLAEVAGAEQRDVVLARGPQDLADLARPASRSVVADAALAELAEPGEVAADLGRVDVRVLGELLRGDRLLAHLAGLGQHLEVAREARRDAEREALAVEPSSEPPPRPVAPFFGAFVPTAPFARSGSCVDTTDQASSAARSASASRTSAETSAPSTSITGIRSRCARSSRSSPSMLTSRSSKPTPSVAKRQQLVPRLVAEVAVRPPVEGHPGIGASASVIRSTRPRTGTRDMASGSRKRAAEAIIAALSVQSSARDQLQRDPAPLADLGRALAQQRVRGDPAAERDRAPVAGRRARARAWPSSWPTTAAWNDAARSARARASSSESAARATA